MQSHYTLSCVLNHWKMMLEDIFIKNISRLFVQQTRKIMRFLNNSFFNFTVITETNKSKCHEKTHQVQNACKKFHIRVYFYK